mmetsp:Transcript_72517/g.151420  ORF Transcript_72517/g.151420 Transcript_72517/m.151420 type:complete len:318 (+) Transcript_72517:231-1184(+)
MVLVVRAVLIAELLVVCGLRGRHVGVLAQQKVQRQLLRRRAALPPLGRMLHGDELVVQPINLVVRAVVVVARRAVHLHACVLQGVLAVLLLLDGFERVAVRHAVLVRCLVVLRPVPCRVGDRAVHIEGPSVMIHVGRLQRFRALVCLCHVSLALQVPQPPLDGRMVRVCAHVPSILARALVDGTRLCRVRTRVPTRRRHGTVDVDRPPVRGNTSLVHGLTVSSRAVPGVGTEAVLVQNPGSVNEFVLGILHLKTSHRGLWERLSVLRPILDEIEDTVELLWLCACLLLSLPERCDVPGNIGLCSSNLSRSQEPLLCS